MSEPEPKFLVDHMLGTLAKWLRLLGYDATYEKGLDDDALLELAMEKGLVLLTRDRELASRAGERALYLPERGVRGQLERLKGSLGIQPEAILSRCSLCNSTVEGIDPAAARGRVPEAVLFRHSEFYLCRACGKVYWIGSHFEEMLRQCAEVWPEAIPQWV